MNQYGFQQSQVDRILEDAEVKRYRAGEYLSSEGTQAAAFSFVVSGYLRVYATDAHGKKWTRYLAQPGGFMASTDTLLFGHPAEETIECITDCVLTTISIERYEKLKDEPELRIRLQEVIIRILIDIARERSQLLPMNATERYGYFLRKYPGLIENVPLGDIASYIGIRQQSLSRIRRQRRESVK